MAVVDIHRSNIFQPQRILQVGGVFTLSSLPTQKEPLSESQTQREQSFYQFLLLLRAYPQLCSALLTLALASGTVSRQYLGANGTTTTGKGLAEHAKLPLVKGGEKMKELAEKMKFAREGEKFHAFLQHLKLHPELDWRIDELILLGIQQGFVHRNGVIVDAKIIQLLIQENLRRHATSHNPLRTIHTVAQNPFHIVVDVPHEVANQRIQERNNGEIQNPEEYRFRRWIEDFLRYLHLYGILLTREELLKHAHAIINTQVDVRTQAQEFWETMQYIYGPGLLPALRRE